MKLLGAEEEELAEGDGERAGQLGKTEGRRIAAEEEIQDELLAGGNAGDQIATRRRKRIHDRVVGGPNMRRQDLQLGTRRGNRALGRHRNHFNEFLPEPHRLATLMRIEEIADLVSAILTA